MVFQSEGKDSVIIEDPFTGDTVRVITGSQDPTLTETPAEVGSIFLRNDGSLYQKTGAGNTDWSFSTSSEKVITSALNVGDADHSLSITDPPVIMVSPSVARTVTLPLLSTPGLEDGRMFEIKNLGTFAPLTVAATPPDVIQASPADIPSFGIGVGFSFRLFKTNTIPGKWIILT